MQQGQRPLFVRPVGPNPAIVSAGCAGGRWPPGHHPGRSVAGPVSNQARACGPVQGFGAANPQVQVQSQAAPSPQFLGPGALDATYEDIQEDRDMNSLRSLGGSLVSSVTTLPCGSVGEAAGLGGNTGGRWSGVNIQEALATMEILAVRVNESLEQMPSRLEEAASEFRADTTCLIQAIKEDVTLQIGQGLSAERNQRQEVLEEVRSMGHDLRDQLNQEVERLRDSVMREMRERMDGQKVLREEVQLQQGSLMRLTSRVEESLVELRTEIPRLGQEQTTLRDDFQRLQEAVGINGHGGLQARLDQCERMLKEQKEQQMAVENGLRQGLEDVSKIVNDQSTGLQKALDDSRQLLEKLDEQKEVMLKSIQSLRDEQSERAAAWQESMDKGQSSLRKLLEAAENNERLAIEGVNRRLDELSELLESADDEVQKSLSIQIQSESQDIQSHMRQQLDSMERSIVELHDGVRHWADRRISESSSATQSWVEASVVNRITALDKMVKKEMIDRSSANEQILGMITHNSERWCQLQAKFDEILVYIQKGSSAGDAAGSDGFSLG